MKISTKLTINFILIIIIIFIIFGAIEYDSVQTIHNNERLQVAEEILKTSITAKELRYEYVQMNEERPKVQWYALQTSLNNTLNQAVPLFTEPESKALFDAILAGQDKRKTVFDKLVVTIEQSRSSELVVDLGNQLAMMSQDRVDQASRLVELSLEKETATHQMLNIIINTLGFLAVGITIFSYFVGRRISRSLTILQQEFTQIAMLDFSTTTTTTDENSNDEIGQLTRTFNEMTIKLKESYANLEQKVGVRTQDLKNANMAAQNVLEDLNTEKSKLEMANAKDEAMLDSIGDGLVVVDRDLKTTLINKAAESTTGWSSQEVLGKIWPEVIVLATEDGKPVPSKKWPLFLAVHEGITTTTNTTYLYTRKNKTKFPAAITVSPIKVGSETIGAILVFRDITRERAIDKAKTEFVSLASHQLRTPLSAVNWYTEMLLTGDVGKLNSKQKKYLDEVYRGNKRMVILVNALLNVSRLELGTFAIEPEPTDMSKIAQSTIDEQKKEISAKQITLSFSSGKDIPIIPADPKFLHIIMLNILSNAIKYTPEGGKISVSLSLDKKKNVLLKISDTGYGIPKNQQDKIFTKLFRADNVREKETEGTGLGLYIVKSIIDNSAGKIWFESVENKGTTFFVTIPITGMKKKAGTKTLTL